MYMPNDQWTTLRQIRLLPAAFAVISSFLVILVPALAQDPKPEDYEQLCQIMGSEVVRRIAPPFPESRSVYYFEKLKEQAESVPELPGSMVFECKNGKIKGRGMFYGADGQELAQLLKRVARIHPHQIVGDDDLRKRRISGDFVVAADAASQSIVRRLEKILNEEVSLGIRLRFRQEEQEVYVARGKFSYRPIKLEGRRLLVSGDFDKFIQWLPGITGHAVVSEVREPPKSKFDWQLKLNENLEEPLQADEVLRQFTKQMGLRFTKERRKATVLRIERRAMSQ